MITTRVLTEDDLEVWVRMRICLWPHSDLAAHREEAAALTQDANVRAWLAFDGENPIGFAEASIRPFANGCDTRPVVFLEGIWVEEAWRKRSTGRQLIDRVEAWALSLGICEVGSDALLDNTLSHHCHERWGFHETERVVYFRKRLGQE